MVSCPTSYLGHQLKGLGNHVILKWKRYWSFVFWETSSLLARL